MPQKMRSPDEDIDSLIADLGQLQVGDNLSGKSQDLAWSKLKPSDKRTPNLPKLQPALIGHNTAAMAVRPPAELISKDTIIADPSGKDWHKERLKLRAPRQPQKEVPPDQLHRMTPLKSDPLILGNDPLTQMSLEVQREKMLRSHRLKVSGPDLPPYHSSSSSSHTLPRLTSKLDYVTRYDRDHPASRRHEVSSTSATLLASRPPVAQRPDAVNTYSDKHRQLIARKSLPSAQTASVPTIGYSHGSMSNHMALQGTKTHGSEPHDMTTHVPISQGTKTCGSVPHGTATHGSLPHETMTHSTVHGSRYPYTEKSQIPSNLLPANPVVSRDSHLGAYTPAPPKYQTDGHSGSYSTFKRKLRYQTSDLDQAISLHKPSPGYHLAVSPREDQSLLDYDLEMKEYLRMQREMEQLHASLESQKANNTCSQGVLSRKNQDVFNNRHLFSTLQDSLALRSQYEQGDGTLNGSPDSSVGDQPWALAMSPSHPASHGSFTGPWPPSGPATPAAKSAISVRTTAATTKSHQDYFDEFLKKDIDSFLKSPEVAEISKALDSAIQSRSSSPKQKATDDVMCKALAYIMDSDNDEYGDDDFDDDVENSADTESRDDDSDEDSIDDEDSSDNGDDDEYEDDFESDDSFE